MSKTLKTVFICLVVLTITAGGCMYAIRKAYALPAAEFPAALEQTEQHKPDSGYIVKSGTRINDGIHTVNENQRSGELEEIMREIARETEY